MLDLIDVKKYFPVRSAVLRRKIADVRAVDGITLHVEKKEIVGLVGESGSGKSTLGYTVIGMHKPTAGGMLFKGRDLVNERSKNPREVSKQMQIVFQDPGSSLNPRRTIKQTLELPLKIHGLGNRTERLALMRDLMRTVELPDAYLYCSPSSLSRLRVPIEPVGAASESPWPPAVWEGLDWPSVRS